MSDLLSCNCSQCRGEFKFNRSDFHAVETKGPYIFGQTVPCPHCGQSTRTYIPSAAPPVAVKAIDTPKHVIVDRPNHGFGIFSSVVLGFIGVLAIGNAMTMTIEERTIMHQIYVALNAFGGLIIFALAIIMNILAHR